MGSHLAIAGMTSLVIHRPECEPCIPPPGATSLLFSPVSMIPSGLVSLGLQRFTSESPGIHPGDEALQSPA